ncbi:MAG: transcriptional regulator [Acidobacteria bacterium]|nr:transcriptional regulator [Acidobacteriota bacterium]
MPAGGGVRFGPFRLDQRGRALYRDGGLVSLQPLLFDLLDALVSRPGELLTKEALIKVGWPNHEVADNNLTQAISKLRTTLDPDHSERYIQTVPRRGYRFVATITGDESALTDAELDDMMAPHAALLDGRTMLETLTTDQVESAILLFTDLVARNGRRALPHIGLATAYVLRYDATKSSASPDRAALDLAVHHAREARRLDPALGQAWATYGFVIDRTGDHRAAVSALIHSLEIEPDAWANHLRLSWCTWGDQRERAARRARELRGDLAVAFWLLATVSVARNELAQAEREIDAALDITAAGLLSGYAGAGLNWLKALLCMARDADAEADMHLDRELALEVRGHVYARECCASAWYARAGLRRRRGETAGVRDALAEVLKRVPLHPMATGAMMLLDGRVDPAIVSSSAADAAGSISIDEALVRGLIVDAGGQPDLAASFVTAALTSAPPGSAGWQLPVDPFLLTYRRPDTWRTAVATIRERTHVWV